MTLNKEWPKKQVTIKVTQQDEMTIEAYVAPAKGLVVHRQVRWSPGKEEHKFTSKWQVTHEPSGLGLLTPTKCLPRQKDAMKLSRRLQDLTKWENRTADDLTNDEKLLNAVKGVYDGIMREQEAEEQGEIVVDEEYEARYYVERNRTTRKYEVKDRSKKDEVVEEHTHRGKAWRAAHNLNESAGV